MEHIQKPVYEQIEDDEDQFNESKQQSQTNHHGQQSEYDSSHRYLSNQQDILKYEEQRIAQSNAEKKISEGFPVIKSLQQVQVINHQQLGKYANLEEQNEDGQNIKISITKSQRKGGIVSYYFVYFIQGYDTKGKFSIARRFNEFFEMRAAIVSRWPGCFVPSIPAKNALNKNDISIIKIRTRYLNEFTKKMAKLPHLYYSEQFQTFLRSQEADVSETFAKWPVPTSQSIINKYRVNFSQLAGKEINFETTQKINSFSQLIKKNQTQLVKQTQNMKNLAQSYDKVLATYGNVQVYEGCFFTHVFPTYEKVCLTQYCGNKEGEMLYMNDSEIKLQEHQMIAGQALIENPFWAFYDLIRHEERDALAFAQVFEAKVKYENKKHTIDIKISQNEKNVAELSLGKKPFSTLTAKRTNDEIKYKLEVQIQELKRQKQNILIIIDIITAMIAYIEIERYKNQKSSFYIKAMAKIGSNQIASVQNLAEIWNGIRTSTQSRLNIFN